MAYGHYESLVGALRAWSSNTDGGHCSIMEDAADEIERAAVRWRPMSENSFPWPHKDVLILAFDKDNETLIDIFRCRCAEHGAYFPKDGGMLSIIECGWIPFAFCDDDIPERDDAKYPPMRSDYLTQPQDA